MKEVTTTVVTAAAAAATSGDGVRPWKDKHKKKKDKQRKKKSGEVQASTFSVTLPRKTPWSWAVVAAFHIAQRRIRFSQHTTVVFNVVDAAAGAVTPAGAGDGAAAESSAAATACAGCSSVGEASRTAPTTCAGSGPRGMRCTGGPRRSPRFSRHPTISNPSTARGSQSVSRL